MIKRDFIAVIPARSGSKELKNKNIKKILGHPLIAYTIKAAKLSKYIREVYVTTDGNSIADQSRKYGAKIIKRPKKLANSTILPDAAVVHAINQIEKKIKFNNVVFLQPTSPLRSKQDINLAIELYKKKKADCLFSSVELHSTMWRDTNSVVRPYHKSFKIVTSRDKLGINVVDNGSFYITNKKLFKKFKHRLAGKKIITYKMEPWTIFEIDNTKDFNIVKWLISSKNKPQKMILI